MSLVLIETLGKQHQDEGSGGGAECFGTMALSFFTVFRCVVTGECSDAHGRPLFHLIALKYGWPYALFYCVCMMFMTFGLFNVIVSIFIENVLAAAKSNAQLLKRQRLR